MNRSTNTSEVQQATLYYLGPQGTFTQEAALQGQTIISEAIGIECELKAVERAKTIVDCVEKGHGWGVLAWENNVEGTVVPNMDALVDARQVAGFCKLSLDIVFDAFVRPDHAELTEIRAHAHGLAQCSGFIHKHQLRPVAASSNAVACRDLTLNQVGLGPSICGPLYGLDTLQEAVQDFQAAHTDFLLLAQRDQVKELVQKCASRIRRENRLPAFESVIAFIPLQTGAGVLANLLDRVRDAGLNMTSFMSRPIKGHDGTYSFIMTVDAAPWEAELKRLIVDVIDRGVWVKTLAVFPRTPRANPPVDQWMLPVGGMTDTGHGTDDNFSGRARKELLW